MVEMAWIQIFLDWKIPEGTRRDEEEQHPQDKSQRLQKLPGQPATIVMIEAEKKSLMEVNKTVLMF